MPYNQEKNQPTGFWAQQNSREEKIQRIIVLTLIGALALTLPAPAANKPLHQVATITLEFTSVGVGATFSWGRGWLTFKGKQYPIKVSATRR